ncbi:MAG: hypothetical protein FVQ80_01300 [Planctomycetes bacterium]|nr:hypothetical protein [Planctomycetota bacterium]
MSNRISDLESQQELARLARHSSTKTQEVSVVTSPGARVTTWAAVVKSNDSYNHYNVETVEVIFPGFPPAESGDAIQAVNLAESFTQPGTLAAGTYIVMSRVGDKNVFYAPV